MQLYIRAISYFREDLSKIIVSLLLIAASALANVAWTVPVAILIDVVLTGKQLDYWPYQLFRNYAPTSAVAQIILLAGSVLAIRAIGEVLRMFQTILSIQVGYTSLMRVRSEVFAKLQSLSLGYHKDQPQGDAIYRMSNDAQGFQALLTILVNAIVNLTTLLAMGWVMFSMSWRLTLVALAIVPLLLLAMVGYSRRFKRLHTSSFEAESKITTVIQRSLASIGLMQAFRRERDEFANFQTTQGSSIASKLRLHWEEVIYLLLLGLIFALGAAAIIGYGGYLSYTQPELFGVGMLSTFLVFLDKLYEPLNKLSATGSSLQATAAQIQRVFDVLDRDSGIKDAPDAMAMPCKSRVFSLENVGFEYREGQPVLQGISVRISPGEMAAFVGSSGVGKSTLLNLLPRFYDPTSGAVKLDEFDARKVKIADLRKHIALVLQDSVILPTTVAENIAYGQPAATLAQIKHAAELAGAASFIEAMPQKYQTVISEAGSNLSGGQKQRLSIARALLTEAPIIVLDEPTSALDPQHEQMIVETLRGLKRQRTIIIVSHRLSTVADCDQIFVMDQGKIVEQGTHQALVDKRGLYFTMARHQLKLEDAGSAVA